MRKRANTFATVFVSPSSATRRTKSRRQLITVIATCCKNYEWLSVRTERNYELARVIVNFMAEITLNDMIYVYRVIIICFF